MPSCRLDKMRSFQILNSLICYYVALLVGRITGLARLSVRPSACRVRVLTRKLKGVENKIGVNVPEAAAAGELVFSSEGQGQGCAAVGRRPHNMSALD